VKRSASPDALRAGQAIVCLGSRETASERNTDGDGAQRFDTGIDRGISARLVAQWEAWKNQHAASNNAIIADDFNSFWPDGSRHIGKPTAQQMSEQPITGYKLSQLRVVPVGADAALATYFANVKPLATAFFRWPWERSG
jgi:hypothetical protein